MDNYDNSKLVVPLYDETHPMPAMGISFPFSDKYMKYDKTLHRYFLTPEAMTKYEVEFVDEKTTEEMKVFLEKVTNAVYSAIKEKAGKRNYPFMCFRIAKGYAQNMSPLDFRRMFFNDIMLEQARYMAGAGYAKDMQKVIMSETGRLKDNNLEKSDLYWLHDDVITSLEMLNLTNPQRINQMWGAKWSEY